LEPYAGSVLLGTFRMPGEIALWKGERFRPISKRS
jgi:hypothetical protein